MLMLTPPTDHSVYGTDGSSLDLDSGSPACKRLISGSFAQSEVISLIEKIYTSQDEIEMTHGLCEDDAQTFIDVVYEVRLALFVPWVWSDYVFPLYSSGTGRP